MDHDPGLVERLVVSPAKLAWERFAAEKWRAWLRDLEAPLVVAGFAEPVARRYQVSDGKNATVYTGGQPYSGFTGESLREGLDRALGPGQRPVRLVPAPGGLPGAFAPSLTRCNPSG